MDKEYYYKEMIRVGLLRTNDTNLQNNYREFKKILEDALYNLYNIKNNTNEAKNAIANGFNIDGKMIDNGATAEVFDKTITIIANLRKCLGECDIKITELRNNIINYNAQYRNLEKKYKNS